eukprot:291141-Prymnesium_polylepis.1
MKGRETQVEGEPGARFISTHSSSLGVPARRCCADDHMRLILAVSPRSDASMRSGVDLLSHIKTGQNS